MKRTYILFVIIVFIFCCNHINDRVDELVIKKLSEINDYPSPYVGLFLFINKDSSDKCYVGINSLYTLYKTRFHNKYSKFSLFLSKALNQEINFSNLEIDNIQTECFKLDDSITFYYQLSGFNGLIKKYCIHDNKGNIVLIRNNLTYEQTYSILYYLFINNFKITYDDYIGNLYHIDRW